MVHVNATSDCYKLYGRGYASFDFIHLYMQRMRQSQEYIHAIMSVINNVSNRIYEVAT